jgi:hypothetical protein
MQDAGLRDPELTQPKHPIPVRGAGQMQPVDRRRAGFSEQALCDGRGSARLGDQRVSRVRADGDSGHLGRPAESTERPRLLSRSFFAVTSNTVHVDGQARLGHISRGVRRLRGRGRGQAAAARPGVNPSIRYRRLRVERVRVGRRRERTGGDVVALWGRYVGSMFLVQHSCRRPNLDWSHQTDWTQLCDGYESTAPGTTPGLEAGRHRPISRRRGATFDHL